MSDVKEGYMYKITMIVMLVTNAIKHKKAKHGSPLRQIN